MVTALEFKPPAPLRFTGNTNLAEDFKRWEQKFKYFLVASGKHEKDKKVQVAVLLTCIGNDGLDIYNNFTWANPGDMDDVNNLLEEYRSYHEPINNSLIERYKLWSILQGDGSIDDFVTVNRVNR